MNVMTELKNKKVLVIGLGLSGRSAARFLLKRGAIVSGVDRNQELLNSNEDILELVKDGFLAKHESEVIDLHQFDLVVVSPGIPHHNPYYAAAKKAGIETIGEIELACRFLNQPFLAVTGTNGKTTTTLLIAHVLNESGKMASALGNIGVPLTAEMDSSTFGLDGQILVVELSSFQLETLNKKIVDAGVILNITPDHLDRYPDMQAYAAAKLRLKDCLKPKRNLYIFEATYQEFKDLLNHHKSLTYGYSPSCTYYTDKQQVYFENTVEYFLPSEYRDLQSHDVENMIAAYALCKEMGVTAEQFLKAFASFKKPSHRLEFVRSFNDVTYYDDSKGTNIDAVIRAVNALKGEIILIAGGVDKGAAYTPWLNAFAGRVKCVFAIGQAAFKIKQDLSPNLPVEECSSLELAVKDATSIAKPGQVVLLSPGCSSFDMFRDYVHRGEEFKRIVNELEEKIT
jgi:UDP-N-acetylmuramoylalanine--D-glutamate ligase